ncbi:hypothetical protein D3C86_1288650 [compost metagenome]
MESEPKDASGNTLAGVQAIVLKEAYMNQFKKSNKRLFEQLQQYNRRTEGKVVTLEFDANSYPPANPDYLIFKALPKAK